MEQSPKLRECLRKHDLLVDEIVKLRKEKEDLIVKYQNVIIELRRELDKNKEELSQRKQEFNDLVKPLAEMMATTQQPAQIIAEVQTTINKFDEAIKKYNDISKEKNYWEHVRIELEGEIIKLKQQLSANIDLTVYDLTELLNAVLKKLIYIIRE